MNQLDKIYFFKKATKGKGLNKGTQNNESKKLNISVIPLISEQNIEVSIQNPNLFEKKLNDGSIDHFGYINIIEKMPVVEDPLKYIMMTEISSSTLAKLPFVEDLSLDDDDDDDDEDNTIQIVSNKIPYLLNSKSSSNLCRTMRFELASDELISKTNDILNNIDGTYYDNNLACFVFNRNDYMSNKDFRKLKQGIWLNDMVINLYLKMLQHYDEYRCADDSLRKKSYYFDTFTYKFYLEVFKTDEDVAKRAKRIKRVAKSKYQRYFYPIHTLLKDHWILGLIDFTEKKIHVYDSFFHHKHEAELEILEKVALILSPNSTFEKIDIHHNIPRQTNSYDCGVFMLMLCDFLSDELLKDVEIGSNPYSQDYMWYFRTKIASDLLRGHLRY